jgi:peptidoglycan hydrolase CwlO-like protein
MTRREFLEAFLDELKAELKNKEEPINQLTKATSDISYKIDELRSAGCSALVKVYEDEENKLIDELQKLTSEYEPLINDYKRAITALQFKLDV